MSSPKRESPDDLFENEADDLAAYREEEETEHENKGDIFTNFSGGNVKEKQNKSVKNGEKDAGEAALSVHSATPKNKNHSCLSLAKEKEKEKLNFSNVAEGNSMYNNFTISDRMNSFKASSAAERSENCENPYKILLGKFSKNLFVMPGSNGENLGAKMSKMQVAIGEYNKIKRKLIPIFFEEEENFDGEIDGKLGKLSQKELIEKNGFLIKQLNRLNDILTVILDTQKIYGKSPKKTSDSTSNSPLDNELTAEIRQINKEANEKLLNAYKIQYLKSKCRLQEVIHYEYTENLRKKISEINNEISVFEKENRKLKTEQSISESKIAKMSQETLENLLKEKIQESIVKNDEYEKIIKRLNNLIREYNVNEDKINKLKSEKTALESRARSEFQIKELLDISRLKEERKQQEEKILNLKEKISNLEKNYAVYKEKLKQKQQLNAATIKNLEGEKRRLEGEIKEKTEIIMKETEQILALEKEKGQLMGRGKKGENEGGDKDKAKEDRKDKEGREDISVKNNICGKNSKCDKENTDNKKEKRGKESGVKRKNSGGSESINDRSRIDNMEAVDKSGKEDWDKSEKKEKKRESKDNEDISTKNMDRLSVKEQNSADKFEVKSENNIREFIGKFGENASELERKKDNKSIN